MMFLSNRRFRSGPLRSAALVEWLDPCLNLFHQCVCVAPSWLDPGGVIEVILGAVCVR